MEKFKRAVIGAHKVTLFYDCRLWQDVLDRYGTEAELVEKMKSPSGDGFETVVWLFSRLTQEGNLYDSRVGAAPGKAFDEGETREMVYGMSPAEFIRLATISTEALVAGHSQDSKSESDEPEEYDESLAAFEKKTESVQHPHSCFAFAARCLGWLRRKSHLSRRD